MANRAARIFLPGFAARPHMYAPCLPDGWEAARTPSPRLTGGSLASLRSWALREAAARQDRVCIAGHSMGAALAILVALARPEQVEELVLVAPAGLPLTKPMTRSVGELVRQVASGTYAFADVVAAAREHAAAPRATARLVRALRRLDLSAQMRKVQTLGIRTTVIGCTTDTLVPPDLSRRAAELLGASYRELDLPGGHIWMLDRPAVLAGLLEQCGPRASAFPSRSSSGSSSRTSW